MLITRIAENLDSDRKKELFETLLYEYNDVNGKPLPWSKEDYEKATIEDIEKELDKLDKLINERETSEYGMGLKKCGSDEKSKLFSYYSDLFKDINGVRPHWTKEEYKNTSLEELKLEVKSLEEYAESDYFAEQEKREKEREKEFEEQYANDLEKLRQEQKEQEEKEEDKKIDDLTKQIKPRHMKEKYSSKKRLVKAEVNINNMSDEEYQNYVQNPPITMEEIVEKVKQEYPNFLQSKLNFINDKIETAIKQINDELSMQFNTECSGQVFQDVAKELDWDYNSLVEVLDDADHEKYVKLMNARLLDMDFKEAFAQTVKKAVEEKMSTL